VENLPAPEAVLFHTDRTVIVVCMLPDKVFIFAFKTVNHTFVLSALDGIRVQPLLAVLLEYQIWKECLQLFYSKWFQAIWALDGRLEVQVNTYTGDAKSVFTRQFNKFCLRIIANGALNQIHRIILKRIE
jgi:hypothetical protein